jgi:hypothetical protein
MGSHKQPRIAQPPGPVKRSGRWLVAHLALCYTFGGWWLVAGGWWLTTSN